MSDSFLPSPMVVKATTVYSGLGSRHSYAITRFSTYLIFTAFLTAECSTLNYWERARLDRPVIRGEKLGLWNRLLFRSVSASQLHAEAWPLRCRVRLCGAHTPRPETAVPVGPSCVYAEHVRQLAGASPAPNVASRRLGLQIRRCIILRLGGYNRGTNIEWRIFRKQRETTGLWD